MSRYTIFLLYFSVVLFILLYYLQILICANVSESIFLARISVNMLILNRYIMFGRGICEKYQSRAEKIPKPIGEGNLISRLVFFANTPHNMIYMFNYTVYYLEHWRNK